MNEMCMASRVPQRFGRIVPAGLLICFTMLAGVGSALADDNARPTTKPAMSLSAQKLFAQASPAVVKIHTYDAGGRPLGQGSGFLIDATGTIVTNHHVIKGAASVRVYIQNQPSLPVTRIIAVDKQADLAIIKVDGKDLPFLKLRLALPKVGEKVYAIGSPRGLTNTLSDGLVSGLRRDSEITEIQTSAPITHGSSGGPLLSSDGAVVGVTTKGRIGGGDLNFAVPAERVASLIKNLNAASQIAPKLVKPPDVGRETKVYDSIAAIFREAPKGVLPPIARCKHGRNVRKWESLSMGLFNKWSEGNVVGSKLSITFEWSGKNEVKVGKDAIYVSASPVVQYAELAPFMRECYSFSGRTSSLTGKRRYYCGKDLFKVVGYVSSQGWTNGLSCNVAFPLAVGESLLRIRRGTKLKASATVSLARMCHLQRHFGDDYRAAVVGLHLILKDASVDQDSLDNALGIRKSKATTRPTLKPTSSPKRTDEDKARSQLALAKSYIGAGLKAKAADVFKELITKYPKTQAAKEATAELEKLGKQ